MLFGPYCHECGQPAEDRIAPFRRLAADAVDDLMELDVRLVRTLKQLVRPGALTRAYLGGRRVGFVPPLRLLIIAGFLFLLALGALQRVRPEGVGLQIQLDPATETDLVAHRDSLQAVGTAWADAKAYAASRLLEAHRDPDRLNRAFVERLSIAAVLVLPLFALLLRGLYRDRLYAEHFIFSLHLHAVFFGTAGLATLLGLAAHAAGASASGLGMGGAVVGLSLLAYVWMAMHRVYETGWGRTTVRFLILLGVYPQVVLLAMIVHAIATVFLLA